MDEIEVIEARLRAHSGPAMPIEVEARVRQRIFATRPKGWFNRLDARVRLLTPKQVAFGLLGVAVVGAAVFEFVVNRPDGSNTNSLPITNIDHIHPKVQGN